MWFSVDDEAVESSGLRVAEVARRLGAVDLGPVALVLDVAMPASSSAAAAEVLADLQGHLTATCASLQVESGRLRLAATQYAAADTVAAAADPAIRGADPSALTGPVGSVVGGHQNQGRAG